MVTFLKRFSLLFVVFFSIVSAEAKEDLEKYRLYVTKIDPEFHCFALSNEMVFNIPKKNWETATLPEVGAEVYILPTIRQVPNRLSSSEEGEFGIKFPKNPNKGVTYVFMSQESEQCCLSLCLIGNNMQCTSRLVVFD